MILLSVFFLFSSFIYSFEPIQLSLIGALTVGFPSFVLALQPNKNIVRGNFTFNTITRAAPAAICIALNTIVITLLNNTLGVSQPEISTMAMYTTSLIGLMLIFRLCIPFNALRGAMLAVSSVGLILAMIIFSDFFKLVPLTHNALIMQIVTAIAMVILFNVLYSIADKEIEKRKLQPHKATA